MAQQATVKRAVLDAPVKNKGGRPVGSRNPVKPKTFDFDAPKRDFQKPGDFFAYAEGYPDKTALLYSVYRLRPKIDHSLIGIDQSAILQTSELSDVTEEAIGEKFGRGKYMLKLNDSNKPKGLQLRCRGWLELFDVEKPPQYDPRTLCLGEAQNQDEIMRLLNAGVLVRDAHGAPRLRGEGDPLPVASVPSSNGNGHGGGELFGRDVVGQIVLAALNRGTQSPHDTVKDTIEIAKLLTPSQPPVDLESIIERVVTRLQGVKPAGPLDFMAQYDQVEQFISRVRGPVAGAVGSVAGEAAGAAVGDAASSWAPHLGGILAQARALVPDIVAAFRELRSEKQNGNGAAAPPPQQNGADGMLPIEQRIEQVFRLGFQKMQEGVTGFDFAAYVCFHMAGGLEVYQTLEPSGAAGLIALAAMNPAARPIVNDAKIRPQLESFLTDFFSFDPTGGAEELPPPPAPVGKGKVKAAAAS